MEILNPQECFNVTWLQRRGMHFWCEQSWWHHLGILLLGW